MRPDAFMLGDGQGQPWWQTCTKCHYPPPIGEWPHANASCLEAGRPMLLLALIGLAQGAPPRGSRDRRRMEEIGAARRIAEELPLDQRGRYFVTKASTGMPESPRRKSLTEVLAGSPCREGLQWRCYPQP